MELINQPLDGQVGERIVSFLNSQRFDDAVFIVAFARESGVKTISSYMKSFRERGGQVHIICGIDLDGTSYEGLHELLQCTNSLTVFHAESNQTFHPKMFLFTADDDGSLIVGSSNLTVGGLWTNVESSVIVERKNSEQEWLAVHQSFETYRNNLTEAKDSFRRLECEVALDELLDDGYIKRERTLKRHEGLRHKNSENKREIRFGSGFPAAGPKQNPDMQKTAVNNSENDEPVRTNITGDSRTNSSPAESTFWIYASKLTSGSRNQIDLSMSCRLEDGLDATYTPFAGKTVGRMIGAVEYFGIDPTIKTQTIHPVLRYGGVDYFGSTIVYPDARGEGKRPNGSWRLQLHGRDASGRKLTSAIKDDGGLEGKIVAFTKSRQHQYSVDVYEGSELNEIQGRSLLRGWNGSRTNSKPVGVIWTDTKTHY